MLSNEEKLRIQLEEKYRSEVAQELKPKSKIDLFETVIKILQGLAIIAGIWATYFAYKQHNEEKKLQEQENYRQTAREYRKSFYEKQLEYYVEAAEATATLSTENRESKDYAAARKTFNRLFWGRLSIVEDKTVEASMVNFHNLLDEYENEGSDVTQQDLKQASLELAHNASKYTIDVWIDSTERKNYNR